MEQWGLFIVSHLLWQGHVFLRSSGDPWHSSNENVTTSFNDLLLSAAVTWVLNRTVLMQGTVINIYTLFKVYVLCNVHKFLLYLCCIPSTLWDPGLVVKLCYPLPLFLHHHFPRCWSFVRNDGIENVCVASVVSTPQTTAPRAQTLPWRGLYLLKNHYDLRNANFTRSRGISN